MKRLNTKTSLYLISAVVLAVVTGCTRNISVPISPAYLFTKTPTFTSTFTPPFTATTTPTPTFTLTSTLTSTASFTATRSFTNTTTSSSTNTPTGTATFTATRTFTFTLTFTGTPPPTNTPSFTATFTPSPTFTNSPTNTLTFTPSFTPTNTPLVSNTPTPTATPCYPGAIQPLYNFDSAIDCWQPATGSLPYITNYGLTNTQTYSGPNAFGVAINNTSGVTQNIQFNVTYASPQDLTGMMIIAQVYVDPVLAPNDWSGGLMPYDQSGPTWPSAVWESAWFTVNNTPPANVGAWFPVTIILGSGGGDPSQILQFGFQLNEVPPGAIGNIYIDNLQIIPVPAAPTNTPTITFTPTETNTPGASLCVATPVNPSPYTEAETIGNGGPSTGTNEACGASEDLGTVPLDNDQVITGNLASSGNDGSNYVFATVDQDVYRFTTGAPGIYTITLDCFSTGADTNDFDLIVFDNTCTLVAQSYNAGGTPEVITSPSLPSGMTLNVLAIGWDGAPLSSYRLVIAGRAAPTATPTDTPAVTDTFTITPTFTDTPSAPTDTPTPTPTNTPDPTLIDDFEDDNGQLSPGPAAFDGWWNANNDGSAPIFPAPTTWINTAGGPGGSTYAAHITVGAVTQWANFGASFRNPTAPVDLSVYTGVVFDVMKDPGPASTLRVAFSDVNTDPAGGVCTNCNDHNGSNVCLSTSWQSVTVFFNQTAQQGWGSPLGPLNASQLYAFYFQFAANTPTGVWIDNLRLTTAAPPPPPGNTVVSNFDFNSGGTSINPSLTGFVPGNAGWSTWLDPAPPTSGVVMLPFVQCGGYLSPYGARMNATWTGNGSYPAANLTANLYNGGTYFDITPFTGVSYWIKVTTMTAPAALALQIPIAGTTGLCCGGTCPANCWDHFTSYDVPPANDTWTQKTIPFTAFARGGWGNALTPCSDTVLKDGCNNSNVMQLQWSTGSGAAAGSPACDFWVDNVTFY